MSEQPKAASSAKTDAEIVREERDLTLPFDPELARLVSLINLVDSVEIGLTLHVDGSIVSGMLVSNAQFYRLLIKQFDADDLSEHSNPDIGQSFARFFRPSLENAEKFVEEHQASDHPAPLPRHIHLRYAQTLFPNQEPFTQKVWRGRLTEVDGWSIGNIGEIPAPIQGGTDRTAYAEPER